ncbi:MAG: tetratricopeptide repeat protein [Blastocatellia bacterium]
MKKERKSWKEILDKRRKENFIGRKEQLRVFSENFTHDTPEYLVFSVTGEGGVGKSTLLQQYVNIAGSTPNNAIVVTCNERHASPASAMGHIAAEMAKLEIRHKDFDERYRKYRELREEVESDPKAPRGMIDLLARGVTDLAIKSGRRMPGVGVLLEGADEKAAGETVAQGINYLVTRWGNKDEVMLLRETDKVLTPLFLKLLAEATGERRVVLLFDVFERTSQSLAPWLLSLFNFDHGEFDAGLSFVIAGRDPLEQHWTEMAVAICHIALEPFTPDETRHYLANKEITDDRLVAQIHEGAGGLPVLVELLASTKPQPGAPLADVSKEAVERFLLWVEQEDRRQAALLAAVPRQFNRDALSAALGSAATGTFNWLSTQSFIRRDNERGWFYHEKVRELMLRHLRNTTPKDLDETHARLAQFFAGEQAKLGFEDEEVYDSETWRKSECERVYHIVSAQPDRNIGEGVNAFLHAFRRRWGFAEEIAKCCRQCGREKGSQTIRDLASEMLEVYEAYDQSKYRTGIEKLTSLERRSDLDATSRCEIHALRGSMNGDDGKMEEALADFNRAIELDEKYTWAIARRGETYWLMDKYEEAVADFTRAIELDEKYAWAIASRGETYRLMKKYEEALADFNRVIKLDEKDDWAIWAIANRGETCRLMGKYEEALADLNRAIGLDEKDAWTIASRGDTYRSMGKYEEAVADFTRAIELDEKMAWAVTSRGVTYRLMGKYEDALADQKLAAKLDPEDSYNHVSLAACYRSLGLMDEYHKHISIARESIAEESDYSRACFEAICGNVDEALALLRIALEKHKVSVGWARRDPDFDWLRDDPRFVALLDEMDARSKEGNAIDRIAEGGTADGH